MANATSGNSVYVDSTGALSIPEDRNIKLVYIMLSPTAANAQLVLQDDASTPVNKLDLRWSTDSESQYFRFEKNPITFPNGIRASTVTNCVATLVFTR